MVLEKRSEEILNAVIENFIKTGVPVSSGLLYKRYSFGIKPAMIRHELERLTDVGYLNQPYYSSGRIPSDKGYEFFADQILNQELGVTLDNEIANCFAKKEWIKFLHLFSDRLGILGVLEPLEEDRVYKSGLENLISQISIENQNIVQLIIRDFEELDERMTYLKKEIEPESSLQIFIGKKSPITDSPELSIVANWFRNQDEEILLLAIGPKRMNYKKVVKIIRGIKEINV